MIAIVVPCYNEEKRLPVQDFKTYSETHNNVSFLFVNDGSNDKTSVVLKELCSHSEQMDFLDLEKNGGKSEAIRQGMLRLLELKSDCEYYGFMDADLSTPLDEIDQLPEVIKKHSSPSALIGSRVKLFGSTDISRSTFRHYVGRVIATFISRSLEIGIYDTQCGFKFFKREITPSLFKDSFISRWLFDVELIFRMKKNLGPEKLDSELIEFPLNKWTEEKESKIPLTYAFQWPIDLYRIRRKYQS